MTTEAGRQLLALIDDGTDECVWMAAAVRAIEAEARAALLAELEAGVGGLDVECHDGMDMCKSSPEDDSVSRAAVLDLIRKAADR